MRRFLWVAAMLTCPTLAWAQTDAVLAERMTTIDAYGDGFVAYDRSFRDDARAEATRLLNELRGRAAGLSPAAFELELARIGALARNAHSQYLAPQWRDRYPQLAVRYLIADDGLYVADALADFESLRGARVERVEGRTLDELRAVWARYASGREGYRDQTLLVLLETPALLHAAGLADDAERVTLMLADGATVEVGTSDGWPGPTGIWRYLPQSRLLELARAGLVAGDPLYLAEPAETFRFVRLPARDAVYLQFRANIDFTGETDLRTLADAAIDSLRAISPRFVIVDQRFNIGGDLNTTRDLMQAIPGVVGVEGAVFAITSGRTFSAGIASVAYLKQAAGDRLTIVGAPVGDELEFWAEGTPLRLPNGAVVLRATERHNYRTGCPEDDCHGSIRTHPIRVESIEPDVRPRFDYADVVAGRDPYLDAVFARIDALRDQGL